MYNSFKKIKMISKQKE